MNTFLPYKDFKKSAECLDYRRLGKQRIEAWQIYLSLTIPEYGWKNHPCVKMWKGYEYQLCIYGIVICNEWIKRGYKDTLLYRFIKERDSTKGTNIPSWLGNEKFHSVMRANLLRKDFKYYSQFGWSETPIEGYIWGNERSYDNTYESNLH